MAVTGTERRSLLYIRLAAFLAAQPPDVSTVTLTLEEIEELVGTPLPENSRYPSWWRNDRQTMHARAWLIAGWKVAAIETGAVAVTWTRDEQGETSA